MKLILFDFDGTLTEKDSLNEFLKYAVGLQVYFFKLLLFSPVFILYKLKVIKNNIAKEILLSLFFKNWKEKKFKKIARKFSLEEINKILNQDIYTKLINYKNENNRIIVASASLECWLKPWCDKQGIDLLSTRLKFKEGFFTGKLLTKNCYGKEKVNRINQYVNILEFDEIIVYGNSSGDKEMFNISNISYMITKRRN
jgi:HAD superfamily hydrolase (TIGR01490 family)